MIVMDIFLCVLGYLIVVSGLNLLLEQIPWRGKFPKRAKYEQVNTPIYKLNKGIYDRYYKIQKWEVRYRSCERTCYPYLIPFAILFQVYQYDLVDTLGCFEYDDLLKIKSLKVEYEKEADWKRRIKEQDLTAEEKKQSMLDNLNREFKNNYI